jgi:hypothetical protein
MTTQLRHDLIGGFRIVLDYEHFSHQRSDPVYFGSIPTSEFRVASGSAGSRQLRSTPRHTSAEPWRPAGR